LPLERPKLLRAWWPAAVWIGVIAVESTDYLSSDNTSSVLYPVLTRLFGEINLYDFLLWHFYLRKAGHFIGYGILCLLMLRGWRATLTVGRVWLIPLLALIATALVASLDEWHQTFVPSRSGTVRDVALDSVGGLIFLILAQFWLRRRRSATQVA
jgi:VanZ family protein